MDTQKQKEERKLSPQSRISLLSGDDFGTVLPQLVAAMREGDLPKFEEILGYGRKNSQVRDKEQSNTLFAYLTAPYKDRESLFVLAFQQDKPEFFECLLKHAFFQGIKIGGTKNLAERAIAGVADNCKGWFGYFASEKQKRFAKLIANYAILQKNARDAFVSSKEGNRGFLEGWGSEGSAAKNPEALQRLVAENPQALKELAAKNPGVLAGNEKCGAAVTVIMEVCPKSTIKTFTPLERVNVPSGSARLKDLTIRVTPFEIAIIQQHLEIVQWWHSKGVSLEYFPDRPYSPLYLAVSRANEEMVDWLLKKGAPVDAEALALAKENAHNHSEKPGVNEVLAALLNPPASSELVVATPTNLPGGSKRETPAALLVIQRSRSRSGGGFEDSSIAVTPDAAMQEGLEPPKDADTEGWLKLIK